MTSGASVLGSRGVLPVPGSSSGATTAPSTAASAAVYVDAFASLSSSQAAGQLTLGITLPSASTVAQL